MQVSFPSSTHEAGGYAIFNKMTRPRSLLGRNMATQPSRGHWAASSASSVASAPPRSITLEISKDTGSGASCFGERNWTLLCSSGFPEQKDWFSSPNYNQKYPIKIQTEAAHSCSSPQYHTETSTADLRAFQAALPPSSAPPSVIPMPCWYRDSTQVSLPKVTFTKKLSRNDATNTGHKCPWHGFFNTSVIMGFLSLLLTIINSLLVCYKVLPAKCLDIHISFHRRDFRNSGSIPCLSSAVLSWLATLQTECPASPVIGKSFIKHQGLIQALHTKHKQKLQPGLSCGS